MYMHPGTWIWDTARETNYDFTSYFNLGGDGSKYPTRAGWDATVLELSTNDASTVGIDFDFAYLYYLSSTILPSANRAR
jgi:hypothetical protein